jgi:hypothetical protein
VQHGRLWWAYLDVGPAWIENSEHVEGSDRRIVTALFALGVRLGFTETFRPGL